MRRVLAHWLDQIVFCEAVEASDGIEAMGLISRSYEPQGRRFDLVITDLLMPGAEGWQLIDFIRKAKGDRELPIIVLTTRGDEETRARAKRVGVNAFLTKPLNYQTLLNCLLKLFGDRGTRS